MKGSLRWGKHFFVPLIVLLLVIAAPMALAACGGSSTTSTDSQAATTQEAVAASPSPRWSPSMSPLPIPVVKPGQELPAWSKVAALYKYDRSEPLSVSWVPNMDITESGVTLRAMHFQVGGQDASAHLLLPEGQGPFPVVVYAPGNGGDADVLDYWAKGAARLAKQGYAGLLVGETTTPLWTLDGQTDVRGLVAYASQERRALDVLETMPEIDAKRVGFAGFSTGAMVGGLLTGIEPRIKAFALDGMHNGDLPDLTADDRAQMKSQGTSPKAYVAQMSLVDPTAYLKHSEGGPFLFIWGKAGDVAAPSLQKRFVAAAGKHATVYMQPGGHGISRQASKVLEAWLVENL
jgi:dienelactone hydrolase